MSQTLTLELSNETFEALVKIAEKRGQTPSEWLERYVEEILTNSRRAPIYRIHEHAVDTGIPDLAEHHDYYLYGQPKSDD